MKQNLMEQIVQEIEDDSNRRIAILYAKCVEALTTKGDLSSVREEVCSGEWDMYLKYSDQYGWDPMEWQSTDWRWVQTLALHQLGRLRDSVRIERYQKKLARFYAVHGFWYRVFFQLRIHTANKQKGFGSDTSDALQRCIDHIRKNMFEASKLMDVRMLILVFVAHVEAQWKTIRPQDISAWTTTLMMMMTSWMDQRHNEKLYTFPPEMIEVLDRNVMYGIKTNILLMCPIAAYLCQTSQTPMIAV